MGCEIKPCLTISTVKTAVNTISATCHVFQLNKKIKRKENQELVVHRVLSPRDKHDAVCTNKCQRDWIEPPEETREIMGLF
jgi:hypothetical protein